MIETPDEICRFRAVAAAEVEMARRCGLYAQNWHNTQTPHGWGHRKSYVRSNHADQILEILSDGKVHSYTELGRDMSARESAVKRLVAAGKIERVEYGKYRIAQ